MLINSNHVLYFMLAIIESIMYPVTAEQLVMCVRQRQNKTNPQQQASSSREPTASHHK